MRFSLSNKLSLVKHNPTDGSEQANATVTAVLPGSTGNIAAQTLARINPTYAARYLNLDPGLVTVSNAAPFSGGDLFEDDTLCNPCFFTITVAPKPGVLGESSGDITGLQDQVLAAIEPIRPISIFPTLAFADTVQIALRAQLTLTAGADPGSVVAAAATGIAGYIGSLRLGDAVLYAQIMRILTETSGVLNVQELRLRRCPPRFGEVVCGPPTVFGDDADIAALEAPCAGDITLAPTEVAVFAADSPLMDIGFA